jgi:hypothetical protein
MAPLKTNGGKRPKGNLGVDGRIIFKRLKEVD